MLRERLPALHEGLLEDNPGFLPFEEPIPLDPQGSPKRTPHLPAVERGVPVYNAARHLHKSSRQWGACKSEIEFAN